MIKHDHPIAATTPPTTPELAAALTALSEQIATVRDLLALADVDQAEVVAGSAFVPDVDSTLLDVQCWGEVTAEYLLKPILAAEDA